MKRPSASLVISLIALFFAITGAGLAASHYVITSTRQISPKVLKKLEKAGPRGLPGATGAAGAAGTFNAADVTIVNGPTVTFQQSVEGTSTASCPSGDTLIGGGYQGQAFGNPISDGANGAGGWSVSFSAPPLVIGHDSSGGPVYSAFGGGQFYAQAVCALPASS